MNTKRIQAEVYFAYCISALEKGGHYSTGRNYRRTWDSFNHYRNGQPLYMDQFTSELVSSYNQFLQGKGLRRNTISFYNRILRSVYNKAVKEGYAQQSNPFKEVYTGVDVTRKRALPVEVLHKMAALKLQDQELALSRDLFLFSFQARGMSFVDMAFLTQQNLQQGFLHYVRRKTGQALSVRIEPWMQELLDKYHPQCHEPYLLPILQSTDPKDAFAQYSGALVRHNLLLRKLGALVGADFPLSSYCARHSWATIARDTAVPLSVISSGMGHTSEKTTRIYLASLDNSLIDRANRRIWERVAESSESGHSSGGGGDIVDNQRFM